jgi:preprotein translocase subunit SecD
MAIILDGRVQGQPPVIRSQIGANGQIELGTKPLQEASDLALVLRAGALPAPLQIVEERTIGASLGEDSIRAGRNAALIAVALVLVIMVAYYRMAGLLAVGALVLYVIFCLGGLAMFGFTLTLPGLAGFALSIGMAVDANVLIFERIREELALGKSVRLSVDEGFKHAMSAIIDSNLTTIITAVILLRVGTGPVQGFAVTLIIGIIASMISAIFVTRTFFLIWLQRRPAMTTVSI